MRTGFTSELIENSDRLVAIADAWQALWQSVPTATPFQSPSWLLSWWEVFHPGELAVLALWHGECLAGLAPLYIESREYNSRVVPLGIGISDYLDLLIAPKSEVPLDAFLQLLETGWPLCELEELPPWSPMLARAANGAARIELQSVCPVLDLSQPTPNGIERRLRRGARRAERRGGLEISRIDGPPVERFLDMLVLLHGVRWRSRNGQSGVLSDGAVQMFHRRALPGLSQAGIARLYELRVGGAVAGCYYGFLHRDRAYAYIGGFDPEFAAISPGNLLMAYAIAEARREGAGEFHFLRGQEPYKYEWGAADRWNQRLRFERSPADDDE